MEFARELEEALAAAAAASKYVLAEYQSFVAIPNAPATISTHVDRESQEIILRHLKAAFPEDGLVAEEATATLAGSPKNAARTWVVDPIDGTRGFAMKNGEFSVMIGLTVGDRAVVGVVAEPEQDRVTYAAAGSGCFVRFGTGEPHRCSVRPTTDLAQSAMVISHRKAGKPPKAELVALGPARVVETYSAGVKLAMVARGDVDFYLNEYPNFHDWDVCAGHVLVEEAGGRVTELGGGEVRYGHRGANQRRGMVASNGKLHDAIVDRVKHSSPPPGRGEG